MRPLINTATFQNSNGQSSPTNIEYCTVIPPIQHKNIIFYSNYSMPAK